MHSSSSRAGYGVWRRVVEIGFVGWRDLRCCWSELLDLLCLFSFGPFLAGEERSESVRHCGGWLALHEYLEMSLVTWGLACQDCPRQCRIR